MLIVYFKEVIFDQKVHDCFKHFQIINYVLDMIYAIA